MNHDTEDLLNHDNWEEAGSSQPGVKSPRAIVSVGFPRDELERVADEARRRGMKTSEFIREVVLGQVKAAHAPSAGVQSTTGTHVVSDYPQNRPRGTRGKLVSISVTQEISQAQTHS